MSPPFSLAVGTRPLPEGWMNQVAAAWLRVLCSMAWLLWAIQALGQDAVASFQPNPIPRLQAIPLPGAEVSLQQDGQEVFRFHHSSGLRRPHVYPVLGPSGRSLIRMGHPHDPVGHSHHNGFWVSHHQVNGIDFWADHGAGKGQILHDRIDSLEDGDREAAVVSSGVWLDPDQVIVLREKRRTALHVTESKQNLLVLDLYLEAAQPEVVFGKTPFGLVGVRMSKTIGVNDGGGRILNAEGLMNEEGVFWKASRWVDYTGLVAPGVVEGLTLMDHPTNPNHPTVFHVRNDGWMGACLTFDGERKLKQGESLQLRYGLLIHSGMQQAATLELVWKAFSQTQPHVFTP